MARNRVSRWLERITLGAIMGVAAFVVERRLLKVIRRRGEKDAEQESAELRPPAP